MGNTSIFSSSPYTQNINNSYENIASKDSLILYGSQWAQASAPTSRMNKGYIIEGGIRCLAIVHYPKFNKSLNISHEFTTVMDILPPVLELASISHPGTTFRNRTVVEPKGKSWIPYLLNSDEHVHHAHEEQDFTGWEMFGQRAIRQGNYKAVLMPNASNTAEWELYDLTQDKGELVNLADQHEAVLKNLTEDGWAIRFPSEVTWLLTLQNITSQTTTPHTEIGDGSTIISVNLLLFICILLL
jgi:arylsulfatase